MDLTYGKAVALAVPVFLALIAIELIADLITRRHYYSLADAINSLSCGILSTGNRVFFGFIGVFFYEWILKNWAPFQLPGSHWGTWVWAFLLYDFCYYWNHRLGHVSSFFWASHVVHHQSEEFNLTTALRQAGTGAITGWIFYVPLALTGVPIIVFGLVGVAQLFYQFWPHTRMIGRMGFLDRWIQTPSNHRVHHAQNDIYLDRNYVGVFMLWDHWFGTYQDELDSEPCIYGIRGQLHSWNPVWANLHYYWAMMKDSWHASSWLDKLRVWYKHPGWRPADAAARFPKASYDPHRDFVKFDPHRNLTLSIYALVQFIAIIAANSKFLDVLPHQPLAENLAWFAGIMASLVVLGGVLENRRAWLTAEVFRLLLIAGVAMVTYHRYIAAFHVACLFLLATQLRADSPAQHSVRSAASGD